VNRYPNLIAFVQLHVACVGALPWADDRFAYYWALQTPLAMFDGVDDLFGDQPDVAQQFAWYEAELLARSSFPTDVTLELSGYESVGPIYRVGVRVCMEPVGTARTMRLYLVQLLDHWPSSPAYARHGFKQALPEEDVFLTPGQCLTVQWQLHLDTESFNRARDIRLVGWLQEPQSSSPPTDRAEVHQAAIAGWPLPPDCNANGVPDGADIAEGTSPDVNGNGIPDECEDCNSNGVLDPDDIANGTSPDCNTNGVPDECDIAAADSFDCNSNAIPDECDIAAGTTPDLNGNGFPDACECPGDMDCSGEITFVDIQYFVAAIAGPQAWVNYHLEQNLALPSCAYENADTNGSGFVTFEDIGPFVQLIGSTCGN
jgi:hypothetical protein